ncbi:inhibitor of vertebrate lysozyme family protein [Edwardsiella piscicida]|uniref:inhibitor of vertebrate lysozyme family protein n=1 Tax=Edwardsiella piscicida TaxID=1263550 RepID=UPI00370D39FF
MKTIVGALAALLLAYGAPGMADETIPPSLSELMAQPSYQQSWKQALQGEKDLPSWVRSGQGTSAPPQTLTWQGKAYHVGMVCQPHNCGNRQLFIAFSADRRQAWALRVTLPDSDAAMLQPAKYARFQWLGNPDASLKALLMQQVTSQPDWK